MRQKGFILAILTLALCSCEEVIEVEVPREAPRLVVEGLLRVDLAEDFIPVEIKLSETSNFFEPVPVTSAESVLIQIDRYDDGRYIETATSSLAEVDPGSGIYVPDPNATFDQRIPTILLNDETQFSLLITHRGRNYVARTNFATVTPLDFVVQGNATLFEGDETQVIASFADPAFSRDYYVFDFDLNQYLVTEDTFYNGQQFLFSYFYEDPIAPGTEIEVSIMGADENFYNYMDLLIEQSESAGGPFQTPVATVRGNVVDATGIDNQEFFDNTQRPEVYPLGYFAVVQEYTLSLTIVEPDN